MNFRKMAIKTLCTLPWIYNSKYVCYINNFNLIDENLMN